MKQFEIKSLGFKYISFQKELFIYRQYLSNSRFQVPTIETKHFLIDSCDES